MKMRLLFLLVLGLCSIINAQGNVYLVLGSDTGMWDGLNTSDYNCYIKGDLYTDPTRNGYLVMDDAFRKSFSDSYGGHLKLTWWMMSGNMFYLSVNANTPVPNSMAPYLMKKYHGSKIAQFGDEFTLHYHTFFWSNYTGTYYWNEAMTFNDSRQDFDFTLAQNLIDENMFPVSFRSGWHYMDNDWQNYLNQLLPYSLHNAYPQKKTIDTTGERDNVIDWSRAPSTWVPYHPSTTDYQIPGNSEGWDTRSEHIGSISQKEIDSMFARASRGIDQLPCLWGHLPETDFLQNLKRVDSLVHVSAKKYPLVKFRYCTAVEAYQRWLKLTDKTAPVLQITQTEQNGKIYFDITTDENIFQTYPFFAVKDIYERYTILSCQKTGQNSWRTEPADRRTLAKAGAAVTDLAGNLTTKLINYLPDDMFVDNEASSYITLNSGSWTKTVDHNCFDISYMKSVVDASAGASFTVKGSIPQPGKYNLFLQLARTSNPVDSLMVLISKGSGSAADTVILRGGIKTRSWVYLSTVTALDTTPVAVKIIAGGKAQAGKDLAFDALKISPLVRDKEIYVQANFTDLGDIIVEKEFNHTINIDNRGTDPLQITKINVTGTNSSVNVSLPVSIGGMQSFSLPVKVLPQKLGAFADTVIVTSNDPVQPVVRVVVKANAVNYFTVVDNEETLNYKETGTWSFSNAKAYGSTSRYATMDQKPGARAEFTKLLEKTGTYDVLFIVPSTTNASNHALYILSNGTAARDSFYLDQNKGSGSWVKVESRYMLAGTQVKLEIIDAGGNTNPGAVLRTDAVRFNLISATGVAEDESKQVPSEYALLQNYPNPFNPVTTISYALPRMSEVTVKVYDILGNEVALLFNGMQAAGKYNLRFSPKNSAGSLSSGVYFYNLKALPSDGSKPFISTMKMLYLK